MSISKLKILFDDDIVTLYGFTTKKELIEFRTKNQSSLPLKDSLGMQLSFYDGGNNRVFDVLMVSHNDDIIVLKILSEVKTSSEREHYRIDYKGFFKIKALSGDIKEVLRDVSVMNQEIRNSMAYQIKNVISKEIPQMQYILWFLLEMNNKIDDILNTIKKENDKNEGFISVKGIDIGGGGVSFFYEDKSFQTGSNILLECVIDESVYKIKFYTIGRIVKRIETKKGCIYGAVFDYLDEEQREDIIKYVFDRDRELLKEVKSI